MGVLRLWVAWHGVKGVKTSRSAFAWDSGLQGVVVYQGFFGFLVFSVCVAIYFEYGGLAELCPNGG